MSLGIDENTNENNLNEVLQIRRNKLEKLKENGKDPFEIVKVKVENHSKQIKENFEKMDQQKVYIAGRIMSKRVM